MPQPTSQSRSGVVPNFDFSLIDRLPTVDGEGYRLYLGEPHPERRRPGPGLLFVPGAYHGAWCYANYLAHCVDQGIACAAIDLQGHGALAPETDIAGTTLQTLADRVVAAYDRLPGELVVVGHSMGALPAALCATRRPVAGLVLLAPSPPGNLPGATRLPAKPTDSLCPAPSDDEIRTRFIAADSRRDVSAIAARLNDEAPGILNDRYLLRVPVDAQAQAAPGLCLEAGLDTHDRHPPGQDRAVADFLGLAHRRLDDTPHCMMYADGWQRSMHEIESWLRTTFN